MFTVLYYQAYRDRTYDQLKINPIDPKYPSVEELELNRARILENDRRQSRAIAVAGEIGIYPQYVAVEAYNGKLLIDGFFMTLVRSGRPTLLVMDSLSMFLQQFGMTYWITLLRTALQNRVLPITVEEFKQNKHLEFDHLLSSRLSAVEALTAHIRPEPKRERGRRKLGPIADLVELILVQTALGRFKSNTDVLAYISHWYEENTRSGVSTLQHDRIFAEDRWVTYKYKVRTMAKEILLAAIHLEFPNKGLPNDIWQPSELIDGEVVSFASLAAGIALPDFGYHKVGYRWIKGNR